MGARICLIAALAAMLAGCGKPRPIEITVPSPEGQELGGTAEELARREGEVALYTSLPRSVADAVAREFHKLHPQVLCRVERGATFELVRRVENEVMQGQVRVDVLHVLDVGAFVRFEQAGQLFRYESPESHHYPASMRSPGYWTAARLVVTAIAVRQGWGMRSRIKRWVDLLELPEDVRIGLKDAETSGSAYATYFSLREEYGHNFWRRIAHRKVRIYRTEREMLAALKSGEVDVLAGLMANPAVADGVELILPEDGVPLVLGPVGIVAGCPHPNAAKLLVDFLLSRRGQELLRDLTGAYPARSGVPGPQGMPSLDELEIMLPRSGWELYTALQVWLQGEYHELFRGAE